MQVYMCRGIILCINKVNTFDCEIQIANTTKGIVRNSKYQNIMFSMKNKQTKTISI